MTPEQAERLLQVAREAVAVADRHKRQLLLAPSDVKENMKALRAIIEEIDKGG